MFATKSKTSMYIVLVCLAGVPFAAKSKRSIYF